MLLQEHFFRKALDESMLRAMRVRVDHAQGICMNDGVAYPITFPRSMLAHVAQFHVEPGARTHRYFFRGHRTQRKQWVWDHYADRTDASVTVSERGRDPQQKYTLDDAYYRDMCNAQFVLTPTDVYAWSYRLFEAIMCRAIPVLHDDEVDHFASRFHVYRHSEEHVWREDWADDNLALLMQHHTLPMYTITPWCPTGRVETRNRHTGLFDTKHVPVSSVERNHVYRYVCALWMPHPVPNLHWQAFLAVRWIADRCHVMPCSNSFLRDGFVAHHQREHCIYDRLLEAYRVLRARIHDETIHERCLLTSANAFAGTNAGHDLSVLLHSVAYWRAHRAALDKFVVLDALRWTPNNLTLLYALVDPQHVLFLEPHRVYHFPHAHMPPQHILALPSAMPLVRELRAHVLANVHDEDARAWRNKKLLLIKCHRNEQVVCRSTAYRCEKLLQRLERHHGYEYVNPEQVPIMELAYMLMHATDIITSWGGILYVNMIFFHLGARIRILSLPHQGKTPRSKSAYGYILAHSKLVVAPRSDLDADASLTNRVYRALLS